MAEVEETNYNEFLHDKHTMQELLDDPNIWFGIFIPCIYRITCKINQKSYTGYTKNINDRFHGNRKPYYGHLYKWKVSTFEEFEFIKDFDIRYGIRVYGLSNFEVEILYAGSDAELKESDFVLEIPEEKTYNRNYTGKSGFQNISADWWFMNNGEKEIRVLTREHDLYLQNGWVDGRITSTANYRWVNNGVDSYRIWEPDIPKFLEDNPGFKVGQLPQNAPPRHEGQIVITDGYSTKYHPLSEDIPDGWVRGMKNSKWPRLYNPDNKTQVITTIYPYEVEKYLKEGRFHVVPANGYSLEYHIEHPNHYPCL